MSDAETKLEAIRAFVSEPGNWGAMDGRGRLILAVINGTIAPEALALV